MFGRATGNNELGNSLSRLLADWTPIGNVDGIMRDPTMNTLEGALSALPLPGPVRRGVGAGVNALTDAASLAKGQEIYEGANEIQSWVIARHIFGREFTGSRIVPGTSREVTVYVPAQYDPSRPACVHVNQDGVQFNAPVVFDNLIARGELPVIIGVFVRPGVVDAERRGADGATVPLGDGPHDRQPQSVAARRPRTAVHQGHGQPVQRRGGDLGAQPTAQWLA